MHIDLLVGAIRICERVLHNIIDFKRRGCRISIIVHVNENIKISQYVPILQLCTVPYAYRAVISDKDYRNTIYIIWPS